MLFRSARESAADMALRYARAGFAVALDDFWYGDPPDADYRVDAALHSIVLTPSLEVTLERRTTAIPVRAVSKASSCGARGSPQHGGDAYSGSARALELPQHAAQGVQ